MFVKRLESTTVWKQGSIARLQCSIKGSPELHTTWFFNDKELSAGGRYSMALKEGVTTLEIQDVVVSDGGNYTCEVFNEAGCESCSTKATVKGVSTQVRLIDTQFRVYNRDIGQCSVPPHPISLTSLNPLSSHV